MIRSWLWERTGGIAGIAYVVCVLAGSGLGGGASAPDHGATRQEYARYVASHPMTARVWTGTYLEGLGLLISIFFLAALFFVLRRRDDEGGWMAVAALGAGLVSVALKLASFPAFIVARDRGAELGSSVTTALIEANAWSFVLTWGVDAIFLVAVSCQILRTRALPSWLGWSGAAIALLLLVDVALATKHIPLFLLYLVWVLATSIVMLRRRREPLRIT